MPHRLGLGVLAFSFVTGIVATGRVSLAGDKPQAPVTVRAEEIGRSVTVLGRLGHPLHEMMTVRGVWLESDEVLSKPDNPLRFHVTHLNARQLDPAIEFHVYDIMVQEKPGIEVEPAKDEQWELRAYETWPVRDHPQDYWAEFDEPSPAPPPHGATRLFGVLKKRSTE